LVAAGFALSIFLFHVLRIGPARRLAAGAVPAAVIQAHLDAAVTLGEEHARSRAIS
jgi:hypothetical protein